MVTDNLIKKEFTMKNHFIHKTCSVLIFLGISFNIQAGSSDEVAKHRQKMDAALEDIKLTWASCRPQLDKLYFSDGKLCSEEGVKLRKKCFGRIDADLAAIKVARSKIIAVYRKIDKVKCAHTNIE